MTNTGNVAMGYNATISYMPETVYGVMDATPTWIEIGRVTSADLSIGSEHVPIHGLDAQERICAPQGNESYEISLEFLINDVAWTFIDRIVDGETFTFRIENLQGATPNYAYVLGCVIDEITVSGSVGEPWSASATVKCRQIDNDAFSLAIESGETEYVRSADCPKMSHGGVLSAGATWTTEPSSDHNEVTDAEFTISLGHADNYVLNDNLVEGFYEGNREYSFSFTANFDDLTHMIRILDDESGELNLEIVDAGLAIQFADCVYDEVALPMAEGEMIACDISGTAGTMTFNP